MQLPTNNSDESALTLCITPWTVKVYDTLPGKPLWIGIGVATALLLTFILSRLYLSDTEAISGNFRLMIIHILLTAFAPSAYVYLLSVSKQVASDMAPAFGNGPECQAILTRIGTHVRWRLILAGLTGILVSVYVTTVVTVGSDPWIWQEQNFDAKWMRVLGPLFCGWLGCFSYVLVAESSRLSALSDSIDSVDLLDLKPYQPLIRQGLTNALSVVGVASIVSLFLLEPGFVKLLIQLSVPFAFFAWIGLMLPLSGIRRKIRMAKEQELSWCTQALKTARDQLKLDIDNHQGISEIIDYKALIEGIRNWPFNSPTLVRFALYLLIPLASMFGGAIVERALDTLLS